MEEYPLLSHIMSPYDVGKLTEEQLENLCGEIRFFLIRSLSLTGGHLASNLGIVEIAAAIDSVFQSPKDKIIYDVGHQCYVHKLLTGRMDQFASLRQLDGLSGFPGLGKVLTMPLSAAMLPCPSRRLWAWPGPVHCGARTTVWSASSATAPSPAVWPTKR